MREERKSQWNQFTQTITAKTSSHEVWEKSEKSPERDQKADKS
jgi:hypothetical protein